MAMQLTKKGQHALNNRLDVLSARERQILRLACGSGASQKILGAMGTEATAMLKKLELMNMVEPVDSAFHNSAISVTRFGDSRLNSLFDDDIQASRLPPAVTRYRFSAKPALDANSAEEAAFNAEVFGEVPAQATQPATTQPP